LFAIKTRKRPGGVLDRSGDPVIGKAKPYHGSARINRSGKSKSHHGSGESRRKAKVAKRNPYRLKTTDRDLSLRLKLNL
jgi:hypothetical protein